MSLEWKVSVGDGDGTEQENYEPNHTVDIMRARDVRNISKNGHVERLNISRVRMNRYNQAREQNNRSKSKQCSAKQSLQIKAVQNRHGSTTLLSCK
jgi:hypothetical protein